MSSCVKNRPELLGSFRTLFTHTDVEQARAEAVSRGHAEACVGRVHALVGKHLTGEDEAIPGDPFHDHIVLILGIQRPLEQKSQALSFLAAKGGLSKAYFLKGLIGFPLNWNLSSFTGNLSRFKAAF